MIIVVPARGGSKRVPLKNIHLLMGKPLLSYTLESISASGLDIPTYVSTDNEQIASLAKSYPGIEVLMRPQHISDDNASTESVLLHVLDIVSDSSKIPKWLMTLPPTSPFRSPATIRKFALEAMSCEISVDSLMSVTENRGDFWQMHKNGLMKRVSPNAARRQQDREPFYEENSAVYLTRTTALRKTEFILGKNVRGITIPFLEAVDINNNEDFLFAECLYNYFLKK
mgnify:CR=1 FL=1